jgi:hypothetical protein
MTSDQNVDALSAAEVQAFAAKLQSWWNTLGTKEQALFAQLVGTAADPADGEVQGYGYIEYGQTALGMIWTVIQNSPNPFVPQPVTPTPVSAASSGTTGGSYGGASSATRLN